ncbi:MAG: hypothetical protein NC927_00705, partial [Candidatus Omnitrophica bacterium]|nr:hypothetical protein [Candidatus Omnitrophota bacterium]
MRRIMLKIMGNLFLKIVLFCFLPFDVYQTDYSTIFLLRRAKDIQEVYLYPQNPLFIPVSAPGIEIGDMSKELKEVVVWLETYLREQGFGFALDYFSPNTVFISLGEEVTKHSTEKLSLLRKAENGKWTIIAQQLKKHGRDLQFEFVTRSEEGELKIITMVIKGGGRGKPYNDDFFKFAYPYYQRPFYIGISEIIYSSSDREEIEREYVFNRDKNRFDTYSFIGGMDYEYASAEYKRALAIHRLLFALDGTPAGIPIYTGINLLTEIPVVKNEE